jgi:hypothetical protein
MVQAVNTHHDFFAVHSHSDQRLLAASVSCIGVQKTH